MSSGGFFLVSVFLYLSVHLSICLSKWLWVLQLVCLSTHTSYLFVCPYAYISACHSVFLAIVPFVFCLTNLMSAPLYVWPNLCLPACMSDRQSVYLSVYKCVHQYVCWSVCSASNSNSIWSMLRWTGPSKNWHRLSYDVIW